MIAAMAFVSEAEEAKLILPITTKLTRSMYNIYNEEDEQAE
jgi:hypothetical protein